MRTTDTRTTIIDVTPVSSRTSEVPPAEPRSESRARFAWATLKRRLLVLAFTLGVVAAVAVVVSIGLLVFFLLLGVAALLMVVGLVRNVFGGGPGAGVQRRE